MTSRRCIVLVVMLVLLVRMFSPGGSRTMRADTEGIPWLAPAALADGETLSLCYDGCGGAYAPVVNATYEQQLVEMVNAERANQDLPPLKRVGELDQAARYHATDMAQDDYFQHDTYDRSEGELIPICAWSSRIGTYYGGFASLAENIAGGQSTPSGAMNSWMNSSGHRANILSARYWEIGVGYCAGGSWDHYWVQNFGRRHDSYPLIVNREAATTDSPAVSLYIYGDWDDIRLRNDSGPWSAWQPFQSTVTWTLSSAPGERIVTAEMRGGGSTATSADTITLNASPALGNLPRSFAFVYNVATGRLSPASHEMLPLNVGDDTSLTWRVWPDGWWFTLSSTVGNTPGSFWITPTGFDQQTVATYSGWVTVEVTNPPGVSGSPHKIDLALYVINAPYAVALPLIAREW